MTDNAANPFEEVVILVNGKVQPIASNLVEGNSLYVIFRSVGLDADDVNTPKQCDKLRFLTSNRGGCGRISPICNIPTVTASLSYFFLPVHIFDNGLHLTITSITNFSSSVTMNGKPIATVYICVS